MSNVLQPFSSLAGATGMAVHALPAPPVRRRSRVHPCGMPGTVAAVRSSAALSFREAEILGLVARGYSASEIGGLLGIAVATVRTHVRNIYDKLGVHNRLEAVFEARQMGWLG